MGVVLSAAGSLRWYRDVIGAPAGADGDDGYEGLMTAAAGVAPGAEGLFFLPYLAGERTPHMDPLARAAWIGLTLAHDRRHLVRALLEGVGFALKDSLVLMQRLGVSPDLLYAVGGGARSPVWRQILAAILGVRLQRLAAEEGRPWGLPCSPRSGPACTRTSMPRSAPRSGPRPPEAPDPGLEVRYEELYRDFGKLYPALRQTGVWRA